MNQHLALEVVDGIKKTIRPDGVKFVPLHSPTFDDTESRHVVDCVKSGWVSSVGPEVDNFERELASACGVKRAIATVNGTAALHLALVLAGVHPGEEVVVPTLSFVATANAVTYAGAIPHFADSELDTLGLDPSKLSEHLDAIAEVKGDFCFNRETGKRIAALVPMHTFGHPVKIQQLMNLAKKWRIPLVEDAAESLGSRFHGKPAGSFGMVSAVSFNGNKIITTGGGGAILTNDDVIADRAKHLSSTAKVPHRWKYFHDVIAFNYRMPNLNASLGLAQLEKLENFVQKKRELAEKYALQLDPIDGISFFKEPDECRSNYWLNAILIDQSNLQLLDQILDATNDAGIMTRPAWEPLHRLPMFSSCPAMDLSTSVNIAERLICIPSGAGLLS